MVTVVRTGAIAPGKTAEALTFAHQISKLIKEKHGVTIELLVPVGGNPGRIAFKSVSYTHLLREIALNLMNFRACFKALITR